MLGFCPLASGSKGNAIFLGSKHKKILIDAGISCKSIKTKLESLDIDLASIDAILITHDHTDHIQGLKTLTSKYQIPIFANAETAKGIIAHMGECPRFKIFSTGEPFVFGDLEIHPFTIPHDTVDPVAFTIRMEGLKLGFCTDLGFVTSLVQNQLQGCDYLYVEANHQPSMVHASARPLVYKQRVLSRTGHLSNEACGQLLSAAYHSGLKQAYLAHLSGECNTHETALTVVGDILKQNQIDLPLAIAHQEKISQPTRF